MNEEQKRLSPHKPLLMELINALREKLGFKENPRVVFIHDQQNASTPLGKTGFYVPEERKIGVYVTGRHIKDILRSVAHECVHHTQAERGEFNNVSATNEGYAQTDEHLREMEAEAYLEGNLYFRDFEDEIKAREGNG